MSDEKFAMSGLTGGQMNAAVKKIGGKDAVLRLLRGELIVVESTTLLAPETPQNFKVWKTIELGTGLRTAKDFIKKINVSDSAHEMLVEPAFNTSKTKKETDLVLVTPKKLGFDRRPTFKDVCDKVIEFGLELCPAEVGPQLRKQYTDQPSEEWIRVAIEPITTPDGTNCIFVVTNDMNVLFLYAQIIVSQDIFNLDDLFVFVLPKK